MSAPGKTPAVGATALAVREVSVSYGGVLAVDEVSFDVPRGSIVGLIGPNGAGKTTVFDAICGFVSIASGHVLLGGHDVTRLPPASRARKGLGRSFQDGRLFPSLTVHETLSCAFERHLRAQGPVATALRMPWVSRAERRVGERVDELIELMGLDAFRDKFISELSTGSRRIVDLACVLAHEPTVLLLDEPSSGIAQKETEALGPLLRRVKDVTGCTMLLIEHDMPLITSVSDELIALETGRVIARGAPREVTSDPAVVEAYLGTDERIIARSGSVSTTNGAQGRPKRTRKAKAGASGQGGNGKRSTKASTSKNRAKTESAGKKSKSASKSKATTRSKSTGPRSAAKAKSSRSTSSAKKAGGKKTRSPRRKTD